MFLFVSGARSYSQSPGSGRSSPDKKQTAMGPAPRVTHCPHKPSLTSDIKTRVFGGYRDWDSDWQGEDIGDEAATGSGQVWNTGASHVLPLSNHRSASARGSLRSAKNRNPQRGPGHRHPPPPAAFPAGSSNFKVPGEAARPPASPSPRGHKRSELASPHPPPQAGWGGGVTASAPPKFLSLSPFLFQFYPAFFLPAFPYLRRGSTIT